MGGDEKPEELSSNSIFLAIPGLELVLLFHLLIDDC